MKRKDPNVVADNVVRGWLENQVRRNQNLIKLCQTSRPINGHVARRNKRTQAEAAAIIRLAGSCLDHLDAEAKQARADDAEDLAALLAEGNPAIPMNIPEGQLLVIVEGISGTFYYHLSLAGYEGKSLCGVRTMATRLPLEAWGTVTHLAERYCSRCEVDQVRRQPAKP